MWLGGYDGGISILTGDSLKTFNQNDQLKSLRIFSFAQDDNSLYIGTSKGINTYSDGEISKLDIHESLDGYKIYDLMVDSKGRLWAGTADQGLMVFYSSDSSFNFLEKSGLANNRVFAVTEDKNGNVWVATNNGINKIDPKNNIETYSEEDGLKQNRCQDIVLDNEGNLWISHNTGVSLFNGTSFRSFTSNDGLSSSSIFLMSLDSKGDLWLGNNKSLDKIDLDLFYAKDTLVVHTYDRSSGYIGMETNQKATFVEDNKVWFGTINGVTVYDPTKEEKNLTPPKMLLTGLNLFFDQPFELDSTNDLNYKKNHLTFNFVGLSFYAPDKVRYSYCLEGFDERWSPPTDKTTATFANLPSGDYIFKVKACNEDGVWSKPIEHMLSISPPWWKTWWARTSYIIVTVLLIFGFVKLRIAKLKERQKELELEVENATQDLLLKNLEISKQKEHVEEVHREITDSINYAGRIQRSFLATDELLRENLNDYFVFFQPKEVVSGDFHWAGKLNNGNFAVVNADSTGHGVPGAIMSILNISAIE